MRCSVVWGGRKSLEQELKNRDGVAQINYRGQNPCRTVARKASAAAAMSPVATQPMTRKYKGSWNLPTIVGFIEMSMSKNMKGTATRPLSSADRNKARIGLKPKRFRPRPRIVAAAMT